MQFKLTKDFLTNGALTIDIFAISHVAPSCLRNIPPSSR